MRLAWLPTIAGAAVFGTVIRAAFFTPLEAKQGAAQKIFYVHVPAAWVAFLIPFIHLSVYLFATMHPMPIVGKPSAPSLPNEMLVTLLISLASFTLLYFAFVRSRYNYAVERDAAAARTASDA